MIAYIKGKVLDKEAKAMIIMVAGVGYRVRVPTGVQNKYGKGELVELWTYHHISADGQALFGFVSREELAYFGLLLLVPSVGPKTAINILEMAPPRVLEQAVADGDAAFLTKVGGVGKKTAQRILVELKGKIREGLAGGAAGNIKQEAVEALVSIGFTKQQAREAVQDLPKEVATTEDAVRMALRRKAG